MASLYFIEALSPTWRDAQANAALIKYLLRDLQRAQIPAGLELCQLIIYIRRAKCIGEVITLAFIIAGLSNGENRACTFLVVKSYHGNTEKGQASGVQCPVFWLKKKKKSGTPMATLGVFCLHFCHICMFVPVCSQPLHLLMAVWVFLWLLFVSLQPFILFVVIYSHAEASHYSKRRKSQKSLRLKEMSKDYKKRPFFIPLQRDPLTIIPPATAVCPNTSICSAFVFAF